MALDEPNDKQFSAFMRNGKYQIVESDHKDDKAGVKFIPVSVEGASRIAIFFDENTEMDTNDYISFVADESGEKFLTPMKRFKRTATACTDGFPLPDRANPLVFEVNDGKFFIKWKKSRVVNHDDDHYDDSPQPIASLTRKISSSAKRWADHTTAEPVQKWGFRLIAFDVAALSGKIGDSARTTGVADVFLKLIEAAFIPGMVVVRPDYVKSIAKLFRSFSYTVPKDMFVHSKKKMKKVKDKEPDPELNLDEFSSPNEMLTLKNIQSVLVSLHCVPLSCHLINQVDNYDLQFEGVQLATLLLREICVDSQKSFADAFEGTYSEEYAEVGPQTLAAMAKTLSKFRVDIGGRLGGQRRLRLLQSRDFLAFLQNLCEGQFESIQSLMAVRHESCGGKSLIHITVNILEIIYSIMASSGAPTDLDDVICMLEVAQQAMDCLVDFVEGPHLGNLQLLLQCDNVVKTIMNWIEHLDRLRLNWLHRHSEFLPDLSQGWFGVVVGSVDESHFLMFLEVMNKLNEVEQSALTLITSLLVDTPGTIDDVDSDELVMTHVDRLAIVLAVFDASFLIERFKICWASTVFDGENSVKKYLYRQKKTEKKFKMAIKPTFWHRISHGKDGLSTEAGRDSLGKQLSRIKTILSDDTNLSFDATSLNLSEDEKKLYLSMWMIVSKSANKSLDVALAFKYYQIFTSLYDVARTSLLNECDSKTKSNLSELAFKWSDRSPGSRITKDEAFAFDNYFGSIEVVLDKKLARIYFPLPLECRTQIKNPLVIGEMTNLRDQRE